MLGLRLLPVILSALVLGAHFLRRGQWAGVLASLAMIALLALRRPWVPRVAQAFLLLATLTWIVALVTMTRERMASGEPWARLVAILGGVALASAASTLVFRAERLRAFYAGQTAPAGEPRTP